MKRTIVLLFLCLFAAVVIAGCAGTWMYQPIESFKPSEAIPPSPVCQPCHQDQFNSWRKTRHADGQRLAKIPVEELHECGACHTDLGAHAADPQGKKPPRVSAMTRTDKNTLCGKCHYSQKIFSGRAINPHGKHSLFANVALEGHLGDFHRHLRVLCPRQRSAASRQSTSGRGERLLSRKLALLQIKWVNWKDGSSESRME